MPDTMGKSLWLRYIDMQFVKCLSQIKMEPPISQSEESSLQERPFRVRLGECGSTLTQKSGCSCLRPSEGSGRQPERSVRQPKTRIPSY